MDQDRTPEPSSLVSARWAVLGLLAAAKDEGMDAHEIRRKVTREQRPRLAQALVTLEADTMIHTGEPGLGSRYWLTTRGSYITGTGGSAK